MWNLILYVIAVIVGLILIWVYEPKEEKPFDEEAEPLPRRKRYKSVDNWRMSSVFAVLGLDLQEDTHFESFTEHFHSFGEVGNACKRAGLESSNLIIGVDFTASNEWQGRKSFNQNCLHRIVGNKIQNPYQKVIWILGQTLRPFDDDNMIPAFGFGDSETTDEDVFPFREDQNPCNGFEEVLERYNDIARKVNLSGPTSFAPIINRTISLVQESKKYHILVIIADGQVNEEKPTIDAIVEASKYPISIIVVGVGDGPWDVMEEFDHRLPKRRFDNFRFVDYHKATFRAKNPDAAFALQALMEVPDQFKVIKALGYLDQWQDSGACGDSSGSGSSPRHSTTPRDSPRSSPHRTHVRQRSSLSTPV